MATIITITAKRNGFRRCGVAHSSQPTGWQQSDFTSEQWRDLLKEPQLILAVKETGLEQVSEHRHESMPAPSTALSEASCTPQTALSQPLEAGLAPVGRTSLVGSVKELGIDLDSLWEEAHLEELAREAAKTGAVKPPAKPAKARATKAEDEFK